MTNALYTPIAYARKRVIEQMRAAFSTIKASSAKQANYPALEMDGQVNDRMAIMHRTLAISTHSASASMSIARQ